MVGAWGKKQAVLPLLQHSMEMQESRRLQNDCRMGQADGAYQQRTQPGDHSIGYP